MARCVLLRVLGDVDAQLASEGCKSDSTTPLSPCEGGGCQKKSLPAPVMSAAANRLIRKAEWIMETLNEFVTPSSPADGSDSSQSASERRLDANLFTDGSGRSLTLHHNTWTSCWTSLRPQRCRDVVIFLVAMNPLQSTSTSASITSDE